MAGNDDRGAVAQEEARGTTRADFPEPGQPGENRALFGNVPAPVVALAALLTLVFFAMQLAPAPAADLVSERFGLSPARLFAGPGGAGGLLSMVAPVITHMLIHASVAHLLFNLLWLVVFGTPIARRFRNGWRFLLFFTACGAAGGIFFSLFHLSDPTLLVGASGGITGLLGGLVRFAFHRPASRPVSASGVLPLTDRSVLTWTIVVILMNASVAVIGPSVGAGEADIAWQAHVGGYLFGLVAFPMFDGREYRRE